MNPGDTCARVTRQGRSPAAQRRPGREPRRHAKFRRGATDGAGAQRRPGREPRRHTAPPRMRALTSPAQRRPGREPRRHATATMNRSPPRGPLNEGRGVNPGDTGTQSSSSAARSLAQRRPGREPRRHSQRQPTITPLLLFAQRRPGREPRRHRHRSSPSPSTSSTAQRRPGREPRRHLIPRAGGGGLKRRSTKAGA